MPLYGFLVQTEIVQFPAGAWQGVPALRCDLERDEDLDPRLLGEIRAKARPGVQLLWINSLRWGDPEFDRFLLRLAHDERLQDFQVTAIRPISAERWSTLDIDWIIDISDVFSTAELEAEVLRATVLASTRVPSMRELVWREPVIANVSPTTLELLNNQLRPEVQSWIYVEDNGLSEVAFDAVARAHSLWGVREKVGKSWPTKM